MNSHRPVSEGLGFFLSPSLKYKRFILQRATGLRFRRRNRRRAPLHKTVSLYHILRTVVSRSPREKNVLNIVGFLPRATFYALCAEQLRPPRKKKEKKREKKETRNPDAIARARDRYALA